LDYTSARGVDGFDYLPGKIKTMYQYKAKLNRVVDGDTVNLTIDLGFRLTYTANCRLSGINAPEMSTEEGKTSKIALTIMLGSGDKVTINSTGLDKYGRPIVEILRKDTTVNKIMLEQGHAKPY
jgi:endonuclease YncB( thermonuclease family)